MQVTIRVGPPSSGAATWRRSPTARSSASRPSRRRAPTPSTGASTTYVYASEPNPDPTFNAHQPGDTVIGRFGLKARIATLDEFTADALQGDMGITSPLRPTEFPNPDGLTDDAKPGVDVTADERQPARQLRAPHRHPAARRARSRRGAALFDAGEVQRCHVPR